MKYYLIKIEDDNYPAKVIGRTRDGGFEYIGLNAWDFVELTKEDLDEIQFSIELADKEISEWNENKINKKIRQILGGE